MNIRKYKDFLLEKLKSDEIYKYYQNINSNIDIRTIYDELKYLSDRISRKGCERMVDE